MIDEPVEQPGQSAGFLRGGGDSHMVKFERRKGRHGKRG
jgi:hypothetical protein